MIKSNKKFIYLCLFALFIGCAFPLFLTGTPRADDTMFHVIRIESLAKAIQMGDYTPSIFPFAYDNFGYAISLFYSDFFLYIPALLCVLGINSLVAYDIFYMLIIIGAIFSFYYSSKIVFKNEIGSLIGTFFYVGSAYFAVDIFSRSALGESQAFVFVPLALAGIYESVLGDKNNHLPLILGFSGLVLSHNLSLMLTAVFFFIFLICCADKLIKEPVRILHIAYSSIFTVFATGFFLFPMVEQLLKEEFFSSYHAKIFSPATAAVRIRNLFFTTDVNVGDFFTPPVGITILLVLLFRFAMIKKWQLPKNNEERFRDLCIIGGMFALFLSTSLFQWQWFDPEFNMIQFPWRFHLFSTAFFALAVSSMSKDLLNNKNFKVISIAVLIVCIAQFCYISVPQYFTFIKDDRIVTDTNDFILWDENYLHGNNNRKLWSERDEHINEARGVYGELNAVQEVGYFERLVTYENNTTDNSIEIAMIYFLGYTAKDSATGEYLEVSPSENGWLQIDIGTRESGSFVIEYTGTTIQHISPYISLVFLLGVISFYIVYKKRKN